MQNKWTPTPIKPIDGEALIKHFKISNSQNFPPYIKSVWKDLVRRSDDKDKGINYLTFSNFFKLPGVLATRLFSVFDTSKQGYLGLSQFYKGMVTVFDSKIETLIQFTFQFFDGDSDGKISPEDVRMIFQYIPLEMKTLMEYSFQDRIESQEELNEIILGFFEGVESIGFKEFKRQIEIKDSTIFLFLVVFILTNKPFSDQTLSYYANSHEIVVRKSSCKTESKPSLIASPVISSKFAPSFKILRTPMMKKEREQLRLSLIEMCKNTDSMSTADSIEGSEKKSSNNSAQDVVSPNIKNAFNYINDNQVHLLSPSSKYSSLNHSLSTKSKPEFLLDALSSGIEKNCEESYEGWIYKLSDGKFKKLWFKLQEKYLYCKILF